MLQRTSVLYDLKYALDESDFLAGLGGIQWSLLEGHVGWIVDSGKQRTLARFCKICCTALKPLPNAPLNQLSSSC